MNQNEQNINNGGDPMVPKGTKPEQLLREIHSAEGRFAEVITNFAGSMNFVYFHAIWFFLWIVMNHGLIPGVPIFDPFPYGLLTMVVSLEAIFLSTFIMITQNRQALVDAYRELEEDIQEAKEQREEDKEQQELEEEVEDIQKDLDDIKNAIAFIQQKISTVEKVKATTTSKAAEKKPEEQK